MDNKDKMKIVPEKKYKIVAYGPEKSCLTWADEDNLEDIKNTLRSDGYDKLMVEEERNGRQRKYLYGANSKEKP